MPKMHIDKSIEINAPVEKVYKAIHDFHHWEAWSPWLIQDPKASVSVRDDGKYFEWTGSRTGQGNMTVLHESENQSVDYDLTFLKPWKSKAKVYFRCEGDNGRTKVSWSMDSSLPFFLFWMKKSMIAFVGSDYERGLALLKDYIEDGKVHSKLEFKGYEEYPGCTYVGIQRETTLTKLGPDMQSDFEKIGGFANRHSSLIDGSSFSIYHKWDMVNQKASYTAGIPVKELPAEIPSEMSSGNIPATKVYTVRHIGPYKHLGNAWSTLYIMERNKEIKCDKSIHPFETYVNMPGEVPEEELMTDIHFPVKS